MNTQHWDSPAQALDLGAWFCALREAKTRLQAAAVQDTLVLPTQYADLYCVRQEDAVHVVVLDEFGDQALVHEESDAWTVSEHDAGIVLPLSGDLCEWEISSGLAHLLARRPRGQRISPCERAMPLAA